MDTTVEEHCSPGTDCIVPDKEPYCAAIRPRRAEQLHQDLQSSIGDAAGCGVMVGTGETYLPAFVLAAGLGEVIAGLVASLPQLAGGIAQLLAPRGVRIVGSHRGWVIGCVLAQAISFVPLAIAAAYGSVSASAALCVATLYWSAGLAGGAPWNTWMGTIVPNRVRPRYFAVRTRVQQGAILAGFLLSGAAIELGASPKNPLAGFALLFSIAVVCRLASAAFLARTSEPQPMAASVKLVPLAVLLRRIRRGAEGQRLLYLSLVPGAAYFAGPYFAPYMFRVLKLSYSEYMILIATAFVAKVISLSAWGRLAARFGVRNLLWVGGMGIVPVAGLWLFSDNFWYLIVVQLISGTAWAAYELAVFLIYFNSIRADERTSVLALFNLSTTAAMVIGSLLGGALLIVFGASRPVYFILFGGSTLLRLGTLVFLRRIPARLLEQQGDRRRFPGSLRAVVFARPLLSNLTQAANPSSEWIEPAAKPLRRTA